MLDLCEIEGYFIFCLPAFVLVKIFCPLFSYRNQVFFIVGKTVFGIGKLPFLLYTEETSEIPLVVKNNRSTYSPVALKRFPDAFFMLSVFAFCNGALLPPPRKMRLFRRSYGTWKPGNTTSFFHIHADRTGNS